MKKTLIFNSAPWYCAGDLFMSRLENEGIYKIGNPHVEIIVNADAPANRKIDSYIMFRHRGSPSGNFVTVLDYQGKEYEIFGSNGKEHEHIITNATGVVTHVLTCLALKVFTDKPTTEPTDEPADKPVIGTISNIGPLTPPIKPDTPAGRDTTDKATLYTLDLGQRTIQLPWKPQSVDIDVNNNSMKLAIKF